MFKEVVSKVFVLLTVLGYSVQFYHHLFHLT